jgi:hypothetical protein
MLIYVISLKLQLLPCMSIHNQCLGTELISPVYFGNGMICPKLSGHQIDIGTGISVSFEIRTTQDVFEGALLYKLRKYSDSQYNMDTSTTETNKNEETHVYMIAAWKVKGSKHFAQIVLTEHAKEFTWNENKLKRWYEKNHGWLKEYYNTISGTWFMDDNMTLRTTFSERSMRETFELNISISEEEEDFYAIKPLSIDLERWVALEMFIFYVLIYFFQSYFSIASIIEYI